MIHYHTAVFPPLNPERQKEIEDCLNHNFAPGRFDRCFLFCDEPGTLPPFPQHKHVEVVPLGRRFLYRDLLERAEDEKVVYVLSNADIKMVSGFEYLRFLGPRSLVALSRWETMSAKPPRTARCTQDTWAVRGQPWTADLLSMAGISIGLPGCENALAGRLHEAGFAVHNFCYDIKTLHVHASPLRAYGVEDRLPRPYYYPNPCRVPLIWRLRAAWLGA